MNRRDFVQVALAAAGMPAGLALAAEGAEDAARLFPGGPHGFERVVDWARRLAREPYAPAEAILLPPFDALEEADYAAIAPDPAARLELGGTPPVAAEPLPPGFVYTTPVVIARVDGGAARPIPFAPGFFRFDPARFAAVPGGGDGQAWDGMAFSGFRLAAAIDRPDVPDPVAVFQGASQLRARHRDGVWGASARGLAIGTASPMGEEVPAFTTFWLHATAEGERALRVHALLDSPSVAGAYAFEINPGAETAMVVRARLFPRSEITEIGIAPMTSMHLFGPASRRGQDDLRNAVHDSDGLQIITGRGERLWRPLTNPASLQLSGFVDDSPRAFGLAQRARSYEHFADAAAGFERRPSVWVEPLSEWGRGQVVLVEIPLPSEANDNIVAFWRPAGALQAGGDYAFDYGVTFVPLPPDAAPLARVVATRTGAAGEEARRFAVEFDRTAAPAGPLEPRLSSSRGSISELTLVETPIPERVRVGFRFAPEGTELSEFRLILYGADGAPASETWLYRWTRA